MGTDTGPWTGVLSDGSEAAAADVTLASGERIRGDTVLSKSGGTVPGVWYSPNAFVYVVSGKTIAVYLEESFVVRQTTIKSEDMAIFDGPRNSRERAAKVKEIVGD